MKKLVVALAAGNLAISVVVYQLWSDLRTVRLQTVELGDRIAAQSARVAADSQPVQPVPGITARTTDQLSNPPTLDATASDRAKYAEQLRAAMAKAEVLSNARLRERMPERYPDLGKELGLTPAQLERIFDLLANQQTSLMATIRSRRDALGDRAALEELNRRSLEMKRANEVDLAAALRGNYAKWQEYEKTLPVRQQVSELQSELGPNAMSETQYKSLIAAIAAIAAEQMRNQEFRRSAPRPQNVEDLRRASEDDSAKLINVAAAHLNPRQLEAYRNFLERKQSTTAGMIDVRKMPSGASQLVYP